MKRLTEMHCRSSFLYFLKKFGKVTLLFFVSLQSYSTAQTTITIGNGTNSNSIYDYPAPYGNWYFGAKNQLLIRASELTAQGMIAGDISSVAFDVATIAGTPLTDFTIKIKLTSANDLTATIDNTGLTTVFGPQTYTESAGWNTHNFISPFYWDGTSNLLIETCFNNSSYSSNAAVYYTVTTFNSSLYYFQDGIGVCSSSFGTPSVNRPNIRLNYFPPNVAPVANFNVSTIYTCSGQVSFYDLSSFNPTSWLWNFGDGNTSTLQNPTHTYLTSGTFTVSLKATNSFGNNTKTIVNYITVNTSAGTPIAASCIPNTINGTFGFGITNFTFNTINNTSAGASAGYSDFTCNHTSVYASQNYSISAITNSPAEHNVRAWIDYNNDGVFNAITELVFSADDALTSSGTVTIPATATLNTPLRLRISADYNLSADPTPCGNPDYGQAEDYSVTILPNTFPPVAGFTENNTLTCNGTVSFTDISINIPTAWLWTFGDGNSSFQQHPTHTYTANGTYTVTLIATNANGNNTKVKSNLITVNLAGALTPSSCLPGTLSYCCGYGIFRVQFNTINNSTGNGSESYQDFSCPYSTIVTKGLSYPISIKTGITNPQDTKVWIDFDNNGSFSTSELVFQSLNTNDPSGNITIPLGTALNVPLRMRVSSDVVGSNLNSCASPTYGQVEDYSVTVQPPNSITTQLNEKNTLVIYPNPASSLLTLTYHSSSNNENSTISIENILGKTVFYKSVSNRSDFSETIDVSEFSKGMYFINFNSKENQITKKVIIQ
ncbi:MAG: hypothetical protein A3F72_11830 [Bacteroidetes bacterium RIFCSPLOWO2_12_FULL_35_15]|nr:MAG: hypothetical protein A3F72_11830 [Bacteroidetes bacterium RIFCSPLOWO2_12_FULL_35_15]